MTVKTEPTFNGADDTKEKEIEMKNIQIFKDFNKEVGLIYYKVISKLYQ